MPIIDKKKVGERIHEIRMNLSTKKTSLEAFGKLLDPPSDKSSVRKWEIGMNLPNNERLKQIADLGGVSTDYILFGKELNGYGKRIKEIRKDQGLTQVEFGHLFSPVVSKKTIESWESENLLPELEQFRKIGNLVGINYIDILFGNTENSNLALDIYSNINAVENCLRSFDLKPEEIMKSKEYFINMNNLRKIQGDASHSFEYLYLMSKRLSELVDQKDAYSYEILENTINDLKELIQNFCTIYFEEK